MVQFKLSLAFITAAVAILPVIALPLPTNGSKAAINRQQPKRSDTTPLPTQKGSVYAWHDT